VLFIINIYVRNTFQDKKLFPGAIITHSQSQSMIMSLVAKHNLTKEATKDILSTIKCHLPLGTHFASTVYQLEKSAGIYDVDWSQRHYICDKCELALPNTYICASCNKTFCRESLNANSQFFITLSIKYQIEGLLQNVTIQHSIVKSFKKRQQNKDSNIKTDIYSGHVYQNLKLDTEDLTLTINTDGIPVFKSSNYNVWPVLFCINEIPPHLRKNTIIVGGLWFRLSKPNMSVFLKPIVEELNIIAVTPLTWKYKKQLLQSWLLQCVPLQIVQQDVRFKDTFNLMDSMDALGAYIQVKELIKELDISLHIQKILYHQICEKIHHTKETQG